MMGNLRTFYDQVDEDGSNGIDEDELEMLLDKLGFEFDGKDDANFKIIRDMIDTDKDGSISFQELERFMAEGNVTQFKLHPVAHTTISYR
jgi:Ca2+-binding EF-hand superfamily protein